MTDWIDVEVNEGGSTDGAEWIDVQTTPERGALGVGMQAIKELGSGIIEGNTEVAGFTADMIEGGLTGTDVSVEDGKLVREPFFDNTEAALNLVKPLTTEPEEPYRYLRTAGQWIGPSLVLKSAQALTKGTIKGTSYLASLFNPKLDLATGMVVQGTEDATEGTPLESVAPVVTGMLTASTPTMYKGGKDSAMTLVKGATKEELEASAGQVLRETTGLTSDELAEVAARRSGVLDQTKSTSELTDNAAIAQMERELAGRPENAVDYANRDIARHQSRDVVLEGDYAKRSVNREGLGSKLIDEAADTQQRMFDEEHDAWNRFWRDITIDNRKESGAVEDVLSRKKAGLKTDSRVQQLAEEFIDAKDGNFSSGDLQDIRSDALFLKREAKLTGNESGILDTLLTQIDKAAKRQLPGEQYNIWKEARDVTRKEREVFSRTRAGGSLIDERARPANVLRNAFKGDKRSVDELKAAIGKNPELVEDVKRGILDMVPRNKDGQLTTGAFNKFLQANEGGLKALFGGDHYKNMQAVLGDLRSADKVKNLAERAAKGGSGTQLRQTVAGVLQDAISDSAPSLGVPSWVQSAVKRFVKGAGVKNEKELSELLYKATIDPEFASMLAAKPTEKQMKGVIERFAELTGGLKKDVSRAGVMGGGFVVGEQVDKDQQQPRGALSTPKSSTGYMSMPDDKPAGALPKKKVGGKMTDVKAVEAEIDQDPIDAAIYETESGRNPKAKNPKSTASGGFQLIKQTAKNLGVDDPFDLRQNYEGYRKLRKENEDRLGISDPEAIYAAHFLGAPLMEKYMFGKKLTKTEEGIIKELEEKALPRFKRIYEKYTEA